MRALSVVLVVLIFFLPGNVMAATDEAGFLTNFDVTFFQTMPFAIFWAYIIDTQVLQASSIHWNAIFISAGTVSLLNAWLSNREQLK